MAKIKKRAENQRKNKPKGINTHHFERVYWPYIPIVLAISVLLFTGASSGSLTAAIKRPVGRVLSYSTSMSISGLLSETNAQRAANGVAILNLNDKLDAAAQAKANDMAARNYWSHDTPEGNPPWIFVSNQNYSYQKLGENLATGFSDEQSTVNGWMASPPHRENLLDGSFSDVGFGFANNPDYTSAGGGPMTIVVAFYGRPQVLSAAAGPPPAALPANTTPASSPPAAASAPETTAQPAAEAATESEPPKRAATTDTPKADITPAARTSRLQLAAPNSAYGPAATKLSVVLAAGLILLWAYGHIRSLRRLILKGEAYVIRHPLTDLGIFIISGLLFILSQTAGLIQ